MPEKKEYSDIAVQSAGTVTISHMTDIQEKGTMYDKHVDTFLAVARNNSFSAAARSLFISSTAVMQQINLLEEDLGVTLFFRTHRGLKLTPAGEYLLKEASSFIEYSNRICQHLRALQEDNRQITVGISYYHPLNVFYRLWFPFQQEHPDVQVKSILMPNLHPGTLEQVDAFEGPSYEKIDPTQFEFLPCEKRRLLMAVPDGHPLAEKRVLLIEEMKGYTVMTFMPGFQKDADMAVDFLRRRGVLIHQVKNYDPAAMIQCAKEQELILFLEAWLPVLPVFTVVPVEWDYCCQYGLFFKCHGNPAIEQFREYAENNNRLHGEVKS